MLSLYDVYLSEIYQARRRSINAGRKTGRYEADPGSTRGKIVRERW
jgi:hypothetical protein